MDSEITNLVQKHFRIRTLENDEKVSNIDDAPRVFVVESGVLKVSSLAPTGAEICKSLLIPGSFGISPYSHIIENETFVKAIGKCVIRQTALSTVNDLQSRHEVIESFISAQMDRYLKMKEQRFIEERTLSGKERYAKAVQLLGEYNDVVPLHEIASYIGVTPVQLSRIRKSQFT